MPQKLRSPVRANSRGTHVPLRCRLRRRSDFVDGRQHYLSVPLWGAEDGFKRLQENDQKKNEWAEKNSYRLLRIAYFEEDRIDEILTSFID